MVSRASLFIVVCLMCCTALLVQAQGRQGREGGRGGRGAQAPEAARPPATDKVTPEIPGVVKAGTKIEIVAFGLRGSDAGVGTPDGSVLATGNGGGLKIDSHGDMMTLGGNSDQAARPGIHSQRRVVA